MNKLIYLLTITTFFLFFVSPVEAVSTGLSIDTPLLRVQIKPGKSITKGFMIQNTESIDRNLIVRIVPFNKSDISGNPTIDFKYKPTWLSYFSLSNTNIKLEEPFLLKGKAKEQLVLSVAVPETANLEDIYATLMISTYENSLSGDQKGSLVSATIGANLLISITSDLNPSTILRIDKFIPTSGNFLKIGRRYFADNLSTLTFSAEAQNNGDFITETKGTFKVTNKLSEALHLQGILPQYVISKSHRSLVDTNGKPFYFNPSLRTFGLHFITINIKSENTNASNALEIVFLPFKAMFAFLISLLLLKVIFNIKAHKNDNKNQ